MGSGTEGTSASFRRTCTATARTRMIVRPTVSSRTNHCALQHHHDSHLLLGVSGTGSSPAQIGAVMAPDMAHPLTQISGGEGLIARVPDKLA
jgi:hypothetical protein